MLGVSENINSNINYDPDPPAEDQEFLNVLMEAASHAEVDPMLGVSESINININYDPDPHAEDQEFLNVLMEAAWPLPTF